MPKFNLFDHVDESKIENLVKLYHGTKKIVAIAEKENGNNFVLPCINEMRHTLDHLFRIAFLYFDIFDKDFLEYKRQKRTA